MQLAKPPTLVPFAGQQLNMLLIPALGPYSDRIWAQLVGELREKGGLGPLLKQLNAYAEFCPPKGAAPMNEKDFNRLAGLDLDKQDGPTLSPAGLEER